MMGRGRAGPRALLRGSERRATAAHGHEPERGWGADGRELEGVLLELLERVTEALLWRAHRPVYGGEPGAR